ncbi:EGF-like domain containing protein [Aphelenchoides avenae]|nr:EGF-like domain containing protein [Aphelenchus avenae]
MNFFVLVAIFGCLVASGAAGSVSRYEKRTENRTRCPPAEDVENFPPNKEWTPYVPKCPPVTGGCHCDAGWTGSDCRTPCPAGRWGIGCRQTCSCANGGVCDHVSGFCDCPAGFMGRRCENGCPTGWYGPNCVYRCICMNGGECDAQTGECRCAPGWNGPACEINIDFVTAPPPFNPLPKHADPNGPREFVRPPVTGVDVPSSKNWTFCTETKKFYLFSSDRDTWQNANLKCEAMKGELAVVRDQDLKDWILQNAPKQGPYDGWSGFWTGLRRTDQNECVFGWLDWTDFFTLSSEKHVKSCCDCASLETGGGQLEWRQAFCHNERRYICEHDPRKSS